MNPLLARSIRRHALGWLVAANAVGVWLAALLLWPGLNELASPATYGRWMPLHLDWQLYGWCALPLLGVVLQYYLRDDGDGLRAGRAALACWSLALGFGGLSWLAGWSSGKLFLEWAGPARLIWPLALLLVWLLLARAAWARRGELPRWSWTLLAGLFAVPFVLWWAGDPHVYPAIDPDTGGATGASLLGSTLGLLAVFGLVPWLLRLPVSAPAASIFRRKRLYGFYLVFSFALEGALRHGNVTHHDTGHLLGLISLVAWIPLVWRYARSFTWPEAARPWLVAAYAWWLILSVNGLGVYLPEVADRLKFTNGLVAHAHLAMAGLVTSLHVALLASLPGSWVPGARWAAWAWHGGTGVMIVVLTWLGWREGADPSLLYGRGAVADWCYGLRLAAGLAMLVASVVWLHAARKT